MELYNRNIFKKFMVQVRATSRLSYKEIDKRTYEVWPKANQVHKKHRIRKYIVLADLTEGAEEFSCICGKFNKDGILCSHILKVIIEEDVSKIPDKYIIDRWRKAERKINPRTLEPTSMTSELLRHNILSREAAKLTSKGAKKEEAMNYLIEEFKRINIHLDQLMSSGTSLASASIEEVERDNEQQESSSVGASRTTCELQDPLSIQNKGRPPNPKRFKTRIEKEREKMEAAEKKKTKKAETSSPNGKSKKKQKKNSMSKAT